MEQGAGVGWVEERNPTFSGLCWVTLKFNPTYESEYYSQDFLCVLCDSAVRYFYRTAEAQRAQREERAFLLCGTNLLQG
jgi:hypothetical protein